MKYIVITGGVISGLGKGITASSIGLLFKEYGFNVTAVKIDPYLNVDAGTMSPFEHGECYVLNDGGETDLDLGNYERFLGVSLTSDSNITSGKMYKNVLEKERRGDYLGKTVQMVPHVTNEIMNSIRRGADSCPGADICIIEVGGTVGDIEGLIFLEALRQFQLTEEICFVHVSLMVKTGQELKTKPTQTSIRELNSRGISPSIICMRTPEPLSKSARKKLSIFCRVPQENIIENLDVPSIYHVPSLFEQQNIVKKISKVINLTVPEKPSSFLSLYNQIGGQHVPHSPLVKVRIGIVGKYLGSNDTYLSIVRALEHACFYHKVNLEITWIGGHVAPHTHDSPFSLNGILIPGGFGSRGINEKIEVARFARVNKVPLLGICLGMQVMVIESARNQLGLTGATSEEFTSTDGAEAFDAGEPRSPHPQVVVFMPEHKTMDQMGGTMRLGSKETKLIKNTRAYQIYGEKSSIFERHRHRYEVNPEFISQLEKHLTFSGRSGDRMEITELKDKSHPFYLGCQYHPEFQTSLEKPHPLFIEFIRSSLARIN